MRYTFNGLKDNFFFLLMLEMIVTSFQVILIIFFLLSFGFLKKMKKKTLKIFLFDCNQLTVRVEYDDGFSVNNKKMKKIKLN